MIDQNGKTYRSVWSELQTARFHQGWVKAGGLNTRYIQAGSPNNPPLVMLHGTAGSWENFCANIAAHAEHFNCYAFDMIGAGYTDKPDYDYETKQYVDHFVGFLDAMKIERPSVIGLSLGARVASRFAIDHPDRIDKLVLLSATGLFPLQALHADIKSSRANAALNPTWENVREIFKGLVHDEAAIPDDLVAVRLAIYSQPEMKAAMGHILALLDPDVYNRNRIVEDDWRRLKAKTLIFASVDHDDVFLKTSRTLATLIPNVRVLDVNGVNHWPQLEKPELFNKESIAFLRA